MNKFERIFAWTIGTLMFAVYSYGALSIEKRHVQAIKLHATRHHDD